jgi:hypothetical protein
VRSFHIGNSNEAVNAATTWLSPVSRSAHRRRIELVWSTRDRYGVEPADVHIYTGYDHAAVVELLDEIDRVRDADRRDEGKANLAE